MFIKVTSVHFAQTLIINVNDINVIVENTPNNNISIIKLKEGDKINDVSVEETIEEIWEMISKLV